MLVTLPTVFMSSKCGPCLGGDKEEDSDRIHVAPKTINKQHSSGDGIIILVGSDRKEVGQSGELISVYL